jgi:hypothetical protein
MIDQWETDEANGFQLSNKMGVYVAGSTDGVVGTGDELTLVNSRLCESGR